MRLRNEPPFPHGHSVSVIATFSLMAALTFLSAGRLQASVEDEIEKQIHESHKHLPRYNHGGQDLLALANGAKDKTIQSVSAPPAVGILNSADTDGERLIEAEVCRADAIIVGTVNHFKTFLSADNSTVFTDYKIDVEQVIYNRSSVMLQSGKPIIVAIAGGTYLSGAVKIDQVGFDQPRLIPTRKYVFVLKMLPDATSFATSGYFSVQYIDYTRLHVVSDHPFRDYVNRFLQTLSVDSLADYVKRTAVKCTAK